MAAKQAVHLRVRNPWGDREENDLITDAAEVEKILAGPHRLNVLQVAVPAEDAAEPDPPKRK